MELLVERSELSRTQTPVDSRCDVPTVGILTFTQFLKESGETAKAWNGYTEDMLLYINEGGMMCGLGGCALDCEETRSRRHGTCMRTALGSEYSKKIS